MRLDCPFFYTFLTPFENESRVAEVCDSLTELLKNIAISPDIFKCTLSLPHIIIDYIAKKRPELVKLISVFLKKGRISLTAQCSHNAASPVFSPKEVITQLDTERLLIRQIFRYKSISYLPYKGIWDNELVRELCRFQIKSVIFNQKASKGKLSCFLYQHYGNVINIFSPNDINTDCNNSFITNNDCSKTNTVINFSSIDFVDSQKVEQYFKDTSGAYSTLDNVQIDAIDTFDLSVYKSGCDLVGKIYSNSKEVIKISRINFIDTLLNQKILLKADLSNLLKKNFSIHCVDQFINDDVQIDKIIYKNYLEIINDCSLFTDIFPSFDMINYTLQALKLKSAFILFDPASASIREIADTKTGVNILSYSRLLEDIVQVNEKKYHSYNQFNSVDFKKSASTVQYKFKSDSYCNLPLSITKSIKFSNTREISVKIELENKSIAPLDFIYSSICQLGNIKDTSTIESLNNIFNIYLDNDSKKSITITSEPGFTIEQVKSDSSPKVIKITPLAWDVKLKAGDVYKINLKISF